LTFALRSTSFAREFAGASLSRVVSGGRSHFSHENVLREQPNGGLMRGSTQERVENAYASSLHVSFIAGYQNQVMLKGGCGQQGVDDG
jgi:hypothetical protein